MFSVIDRPLTGDLLQILSDGAVKLLMAIHAEPNASQARYIELVGKCERSVRNFGRELLDLELVRRTTTHGSSAGKCSDAAPKHTRRTQRRAASFERSTSDSDTLEDTAQPLGADSWLDDLTEAQQECYQLLRSKEVEPRVAHNLALACDRAMIVAAIAYIRDRSPKSTPAYLVWCLIHLQSWYFPPVATAQTSQPVAPEPNEVTETISTATVTQATLFTNEAAVPNVPAALSLMPTVDADAKSSVQFVAQPEMLDTLLLAYAVEAATGADVRLNEDAQETVEQLQQASYTAEDVAVFADEVFPQHDWRGQKGEQPTLQLLRDGIAAVRHQLHPTRPKTDGLLYRVQAIRRYLPLNAVPLVTLSDLWSEEVQAALIAEARAVDYCPACELPWSMCRCEETPLCTDPRAQWWSAMIGQLKVQLGKPTFETWVARLRLIGFEPNKAGDTFIAECVHEYQRDWLTANLLSAMVETLSKLHYYVGNTQVVRNQVKIELRLPRNAHILNVPDLLRQSLD